MPVAFQNKEFLEARHNFDLTKKIRFHYDMLRRRTDAGSEEKPSELLTTVRWFVPSICVNIVISLWSVTIDRSGLVIRFIKHLQI
jgi:hypothetical protein